MFDYFAQLLRLVDNSSLYFALLRCIVIISQIKGLTLINSISSHIERHMVCIRSMEITSSYLSPQEMNTVETLDRQYP